MELTTHFPIFSIVRDANFTFSALNYVTVHIIQTSKWQKKNGTLTPVILSAFGCRNKLIDYAVIKSNDSSKKKNIILNVKQHVKQR